MRIQYYLIIILLSLIFVNPNLANDFGNYLYIEDNYLSPALDRKLEGNVSYYRNSDPNIIWGHATPSQATLGYYPVLDVDSNQDFCIDLNTSGYNVNVFFYTKYWDSLTNTSVSDEYFVGSGTYNGDTVCKSIFISPYWETPSHFYFKATYGFLGLFTSTSDAYSFYVDGNIQSNYNQVLPVQVTSTKNMNEGILRLEINDTNFINDLQYSYADDDDSKQYTGINTNLIISDLSTSKVYPYAVYLHKGGIYENMPYGSSLENLSYIDIYINEEVTYKDILLYFDYEYNHATDNSFGQFELDNPSIPTDSAGNLFSVYQLFSDWRWSESRALEVLDISTSGTYDYARAVSIGHPRKSEYRDIHIYPFMNVLNSYDTFNVRFKVRNHNDYIFSAFNIYNSGDLFFKNYYYQAPSGTYYTRVYNSSGGYDEGSTTTQPQTIRLSYQNNTYIEETYNLEINESTFNNIYISHLHLDTNNNYDSIWAGSYIYWFNDLEDIIDTENYADSANSSYEAISILTSSISDSILNDNSILVYLTTETDGLIYCVDENNNSIGSHQISDINYMQTIRTYFSYEYTNQTSFDTKNSLEYQCHFIADGITYDSEIKTINLINESKTFIDLNDPYDDEFKTTNDVIFKGYIKNNRDINYTVELIVERSKNCLKYGGSLCIELVNPTASIIKTYTNKNNFSIDTVIELQSDYYYTWYIKVILDDNSSYISGRRSFYTYDISDSDPIYTEPITFIDWDDENLIGNDEYMNAKFMDNPLFYWASFLYAHGITNMPDKYQGWFSLIISIFFNFFMVTLITMLSIGISTRSGTAMFISGWASVMIYSTIGWLPINPIIFLIISIASLYMYMKGGI